MEKEMAGKITKGKYRVLGKDDLEIHPENPNEGDVEEIRGSIRESGMFWGTLVVQESRMRICAGNHRYQAGVLEGMEEFPAMVCELTDEEARLILAADNGIGAKGKRDRAKLAAVLNRIVEDSGGLKGTGYREKDLTKMEEALRREGEEGPKLEFSTELLEEHQYLVLYFDNALDWKAALEEFGVKTVKAWDAREGYERAGRGRVIPGVDVLRRLQEVRR